MFQTISIILQKYIDKWTCGHNNENPVCACVIVGGKKPCEQQNKPNKQEETVST